MYISPSNSHRRISTTLYRLPESSLRISCRYMTSLSAFFIKNLIFFRLYLFIYPLIQSILGTLLSLSLGQFRYKKNLSLLSSLASERTSLFTAVMDDRKSSTAIRRARSKFGLKDPTCRVEGPSSLNV